MVDGKAGFTRNRADIGTDGIIIQMCSAAAIIADEEDAIMQATGMFIGNEGVGAFHTAGRPCCCACGKHEIDPLGPLSLWEGFLIPKSCSS